MDNYILLEIPSFSCLGCDVIDYQATTFIRNSAGTIECAVPEEEP